MNFAFTEEQDDLRGLARRILDAEVTPERLKEIDSGGDRIDRTTWSALAGAGLAGIALPEDAGGGGYGMLELAVVLEEVGRHVAPVPLLATAVAGRALARAGRHGLLDGVTGGTTVTTFAVHEPGGVDVLRPATRAVDGRLHGEKLAVPFGMAATRAVVSADDGLHVVELAGDGVAREPAMATNGEVQAMVTLDAAPAEPLGGPDAVAALWDDARAAYCATAIGVLDAAVRITASYISEREQFGKPIATFQGATLRIADAYIDVQAASVTAWSAIWRLSEGMPASDELAIAAFWAADAGHRVAHACQHLHGGMGVDTDYPIHRYFLWAKAIELALGGSVPHLLAVDVEAGAA
jgi:alkylation response protein AidB-like acyl-CoA dehydrogenase